MTKTRFCPSPTGQMHLGNARTALFNALYARNQQGQLLLRIEDTDPTRSYEKYEHLLQADLRWLGADWQEGPEVGGEHAPYHQSKRQDIYDQYYDKLAELDRTYPCFCSEATLKMVRKAQLGSGKPPRYSGTCRHLKAEEVQAKLDAGEKPTLRFKILPGETIEFEDLVKGAQRFQSDDIGDFIIRRTDGTAPFMYCNALDDSLMGVTHAFRGEDHLTNTPRQLMILRALKLREPSYGHFSLIVSMDGSPLSKRLGSLSIHALQEEGYFPIALINYMARLGHSLESNQCMPMDVLAEQFDVARLSHAPAKFDPKQLEYWQKQAVTTIDHDTLWSWMGEAVHALVPESQQTTFVSIVRENIAFPMDALDWAKRLFEKPEWTEDSLTVLKEAGIDFWRAAHDALQQHPESFKDFSAAIKEATGVKGKALFQPLRILMTQQLHGPEMAPLMQLVGAPYLQTRIESVIHSLEAAC